MSWTPRVYLACPMTGRSKRQMVEESLKVKNIFQQHGLDVWSPVVEEGVDLSDDILSPADVERLNHLWAIDKKDGVDTCHIVYNMDGDTLSQGAQMECGRQRWLNWRPVIVKRKVEAHYSITEIEHDFTVHTHEQAAIYIKKRWPTRWTWILWKIPHLITGVPKHVWRQVRSLWL